MRLTIILIIILVIAGFIGLVWMERQALLSEEDEVVEAELNRLPVEIAGNGREVIFDQETVPAIDRENYAQLPYEIELFDGETRLVESQVVLEPGESPIDFMIRVVQESMPPAEELAAYSETMYQYSVSFYPMPAEIAGRYPVADDPEAVRASSGIQAYMRVMNFPDDSIGGDEQRFDFIATADDKWQLVWQGQRHFCRRPTLEEWRPADQLCP